MSLTTTKMAAKHDILAPSNIKITKWKVRKDTHVFKGTVLALYCNNNEDTKASVQKLKATSAGIVTEIPVQEGDCAAEGEVLLRLSTQTGYSCTHPTIMKDMCAECGMDLRETLGLPGDRKASTTASVAMVHNIPELIVSQEQAMEIGKEDETRLLEQKKLVLLVDLDQTLIHTTNDNVPPNLKDVKHFQLWHGKNYIWYHTRFRPFTKRFIESISKMYQLHICTFGVRMYAHIIARLLDPDKQYFSHRILSRDECFDAMSKTANLKALFPCGDKMVCIIDDREDVWNFAPNLVHVKPYRFFQGTADINAPPGLTKTEHDNEPVTHKVVEGSQGKAGANSSDASPTMVGSKDEIKADGEDVSSEKQQDIHSESSTKEQIKESDAGPKKVSECETIEKSELEEVDVCNSENANPGNEIKSGDGEINVPTSPNATDDKPESLKSSQSGKITEAVNGSTNTEEKLEIVRNKEEGTADGATDKSEQKADKKEKESEEIEWDDGDDYLLHLEEILTRIHTAFYRMYDESKNNGNSSSVTTLPDLKSIVPYVRRKVLRGANVVFSGMVPLNMPLEKSRAYAVATSLGANVQTDLVPPRSGRDNSNATTHLVTAKPGTGKHKSVLRMKGIKVVHANWLWSCSERWEWVEEGLFPVASYDSVQKNEGSPDGKLSKKRDLKRSLGDKREEENDSDKEDKGREVASKRQKIDDSPPTAEETNSSKNIEKQVICLSDEELESMDKEVNDILGEDSSDDSDSSVSGDQDDRLRDKVLGKSEESDSSDSLSGGDFPRGWGLRKKSMNSPKKEEQEDRDNFEAEDEDEMPNEWERYQKNMSVSRDDSGSSSSEYEESIGSVDDEIADAVEREFLGS